MTVQLEGRSHEYTHQFGASVTKNRNFELRHCARLAKRNGETLHYTVRRNGHVLWYRYNSRSGNERLDIPAMPLRYM